MPSGSYYISMTASAIIQRSRDLADLKNAKFIGHSDELASLRESYRDIYAVVTESNDDYFIEETIVTLGPALSVGDNEWAIPLPADFYKLRSVDTRGADMWINVDKYPLSGRNYGAGNLMYRFRGDTLHVIGSPGSAAGGQVRIRYYPPAASLSVPADPLPIATATTTAKTPAQIAALTSAFYVADRNIMLYMDGLNLVAEDMNAQTLTTLYVAATAISFIRYYRGVLYFVRGAQIYAVASTLTAVVVPVLVAGPANVANLEVWDQFLWYFETGGNSYQKPTSGGAAVNLGAFASSNISKYGAAYLYRDAGGVVNYAGAIPTGITADALTTDSAGNVYTRETHAIHKRTLSTGYAILTDYTLYTDAGYMGPWATDWASPASGWLPVSGFQHSLLEALSDAEDSDIDYPLNLVPEICAYQAAIDYKRKGGFDPTVLMARLAELRTRLDETIKRDSYQPERINQYYIPRGPW
jgi:hypothetical protein